MVSGPGASAVRMMRQVLEVVPRLVHSVLYLPACLQTLRPVALCFFHISPLDQLWYFPPSVCGKQTSGGTGSEQDGVGPQGLLVIMLTLALAMYKICSLPVTSFNNFIYVLCVAFPHVVLTLYLRKIMAKYVWQKCETGKTQCH